MMDLKGAVVLTNIKYILVNIKDNILKYIDGSITTLL